MSKTNGKPLRFAALIRVSTEKQAQKGESLRTQDSQLTQAVEHLGGKIVERYAGQEHGTAGWERQQLDKLLADAAKSRRPFDAVIVADPSRWSRDNVASETGLTVLRDNGVRFFVLTTAYDLFDPQARLFLALSSSIGAFHANTQKQKSLLNRIARARRGIPTGGKIPFGRIWDGDKQTWTVDPEKLELIQDVATRYLAGESLPKLARKHGINHSHLCKVLRERCGEDWSIEFEAKDLNIRETVKMPVPRLLPEKTIREVHHRLKANRTYIRSGGKPTHEYLLSGYVICAACGYTMFGQTNHNVRRYYRHSNREGAAKCSLDPRPWIPADAIEKDVLRDIFNLCGNPAAIERAVKAAIPDCDRAIRQRERIEAELAKIDRARNRILNLIEKDDITEEQARPKLRDLKEREADYRSQRDKIDATLADVPDEASLRLFVERIPTDILIGERVGAFPSRKVKAEAIFIQDADGNEYAGGNNVQSFIMMDGNERREMINSFFSLPLPDGSPAGVYITPAGGSPHGPKQFTYEIRGRLTANRRVMPRSWR